MLLPFRTPQYLLSSTVSNGVHLSVGVCAECPLRRRACRPYTGSAEELAMYPGIAIECPSYLRACAGAVPGIFGPMHSLCTSTFTMTRRKPKDSSEAVKDASVDAGTRDTSGRSKPCSKPAVDSSVPPTPTLVICRNK